MTKEDRQLAKAVNFGLLYGQGAEGLVRYAKTSYGVTLELGQAKLLRATFFKHYTGLARWHKQAWETVSRPESDVLSGPDGISGRYQACG